MPSPETTLLIRHSRKNIAEHNYIFQVLFGELLGIPWESIVDDRSDITITVKGEQSTRQLTINDSLLNIDQSDWLQPTSLPLQPLRSFDTHKIPIFHTHHEQFLPVIYGQPEVSIQAHDANVSIDIFGSCFYLLTRYEEAVKPDLDQHGRFPSSASLAFQESFLHRPLVNEYVEVLWSLLEYIWPPLRRKPREFSIIVTCDVDRPLTCWARKPRTTIKKIARDCIKDRSLRTASESLQLFRHHRAGRYKADPFYTFDWIMDQCEQAGLHATFNFICAHSAPGFDGCYGIEEPWLLQLMKDMHARGHEIGLHGSYNSYLNPKQIAYEAEILRSTLERQNISQDVLGSRQHYLRWSTLETGQLLENANLNYDSTLGFADRPGFRCGTCSEYPLYDLKNRRPLKLRERPLVLMEASVISRTYMDLGHSDHALEMMIELKNTCRRYKGDFVLLWHNSELTTSIDRQFYRTMLGL